MAQKQLDYEWQSNHSVKNPFCFVVDGFLRRLVNEVRSLENFPMENVLRQKGVTWLISSFYGNKVYYVWNAQKISNIRYGKDGALTNVYNYVDGGYRLSFNAMFDCVIRITTVWRKYTITPSGLFYGGM